MKPERVGTRVGDDIAHRDLVALALLGGGRAEPAVDVGLVLGRGPQGDLDRRVDLPAHRVEPGVTGGSDGPRSVGRIGADVAHPGDDERLDGVAAVLLAAEVPGAVLRAHRLRVDDARRALVGEPHDGAETYGAQHGRQRGVVTGGGDAGDDAGLLRRVPGVAEPEPLDEVVAVGEEHGALERALLRRREPHPQPVVDGAHAVARALARTRDVVDLPAEVGQRPDVALELVHRSRAVEPGDLGEPLAGLAHRSALPQRRRDPHQALHRRPLVAARRVDHGPSSRDCRSLPRPVSRPRSSNARESPEIHTRAGGAGGRVCHGPVRWTSLTSCRSISAGVHAKRTHCSRENSRVWSADQGEAGSSCWP